VFSPRSGAIKIARKINIKTFIAFYYNEVIFGLIRGRRELPPWHATPLPRPLTEKKYQTRG